MARNRVWALLASVVMSVGAMGPAAAATTAPIEVATYNLRLDLASDGPNAWPQRREAVKALVRFHGFEILGTQEGLPHQIADLEAMTEFARVGVGRDDGRSGGEHAAIFYRHARFERLANGDFWLSETPERPSMGWDARCCKRISSWVHLRDRPSGADFFVFNAHFDHEGEVARRESARLVLQRMAQIAGTRPAFFLGDLNALPDSAAVRTLVGVLRDARAASTTPPYGPAGTFNGFQFDAPMLDRIDYVFVSPHWRVLRYGVLSDSNDRRYPSDHHPVTVRLQLE